MIAEEEFDRGHVAVVVIVTEAGKYAYHRKPPRQPLPIAESLHAKEVPSAGFEPTRSLYRTQTPQPSSAAAHSLEGGQLRSCVAPGERDFACLVNTRTIQTFLFTVTAEIKSSRG